MEAIGVSVLEEINHSDFKVHAYHTNSCLLVSDLQMVNLSLRVLARPDERLLPEMYRELGLDYDERVLPSICNEVRFLAYKRVLPPVFIKNKD